MDAGLPASSWGSPLGQPWSRGPAGDGFVLRANSRLGGGQLWVGVHGKRRPCRALSCHLLFPGQRGLQPGGERRKSPSLLMGSCLPSTGSSASSHRKRNGSIPSAKDWLGWRHAWVLAPAGTCRLLPAFANADEVCCAGLNAASSRNTATAWLMHARHGQARWRGQKRLGQVNGPCEPLYRPRQLIFHQLNIGGGLMGWGAAAMGFLKGRGEKASSGFFRKFRVLISDVYLMEALQQPPDPRARTCRGFCSPPTLPRVAVPGLHRSQSACGRKAIGDDSNAVVGDGIRVPMRRRRRPLWDAGMGLASR